MPASPFAAAMTRHQGRELVLGLEQGGWCPHLSMSPRLRVGIDWRAWGRLFDALELEDEPDSFEMRRLWVRFLVWAFPSRSLKVRGDDYAGRKIPESTCARPGTWEKVRDMTDRASRGEALFHPDDAPPDKKGGAYIPVQNAGNHANEDRQVVDEWQHRRDLAMARVLERRRRWRDGEDYGAIAPKGVFACASGT